MKKTKKLLVYLLAFLLTAPGILQGIRVQAAQAGDFAYEAAGNGVVITEYFGSGGSVTIPSEIGGVAVTEIGARAFESCESVTSVTIPEGVTNIGEDAFSQCTELSEVKIPDSVINIGEGAFSACFGLKEVTIPEGVKIISNDTFNNSGLERVTIPEGVTSIGDWAFGICYDLQSVIIPGSVTNIGKQAFTNCYNLRTLVISSGVADIGERAFYECSSLEKIRIPDSVTNIGKQAFGYLRDGQDENSEAIVKKNPDCLIYGGAGTAAAAYAKEHEFPFNPPDFLYKENEDGKGVTITGYRGDGGDITVPAELEGKKVSGIGENAFANNVGENLTGVTIEEGIKTIGSFAFWDCKKIESVSIPGSVLSIGSSAFGYCTSLEQVELPQNIKDIGGSAFSNTAWLENKRKQNPLVVVNNVLIDGQSYTGSLTIPEGVAIGDGAFDGCAGLTEVTIPGSVKNIPASAFSMCTGLT